MSWSPRELQAVGIFAEKSLSKLRRIQSCINQQIDLVMSKPDNWPKFNNQSRDDILWRLQRLDLIVAAAVDKKCFKKGDSKMKTELKCQVRKCVRRAVCGWGVRGRPDKSILICKHHRDLHDNPKVRFNLFKLLGVERPPKFQGGLDTERKYKYKPKSRHSRWLSDFRRIAAKNCPHDHLRTVKNQLCCIDCGYLVEQHEDGSVTVKDQVTKTKKPERNGGTRRKGFKAALYKLLNENGATKVTYREAKELALSINPDSRLNEGHFRWYVKGYKRQLQQQQGKN